MTLFKVKRLSISAPFGIGQIEFEVASLSDKALDIAWKTYVQLTTRKAALEIDEESDNIEDIYNSWYELFTITRKCLTEIPAKELRNNENIQKIVNLAIGVLNKGLRPHLTKWQSKYRRWYLQTINNPDYKNKSPQEIQKNFPEFQALISDMKRVNKELMSYAEELKKIIYNKY